MSRKALDAFARQTAGLLSRRTTMQAVSAGVLGAAVFGVNLAEAKNTRKRRRRRRKKNPPQLTCADQCSAEFNVCANRPAGPPLCGEFVELGCLSPCSTDQDCVGNANGPYCITSFTIRADDETTPACNGEVPVGACSQIALP